MPDDQRGRWVNEDIWDGGTLYFSRSMPSGESYIYRSRMVDGHYLDAERLPAQVNSTTTQYNALIAADESYLIVPVFGREDSFGGTDYYIVFRNENDEQSEPINTPRSGEYSPYVPDTLTYGYLWEMFRGPQNGNSDIYWMEAGFIEELRASAVWE